MNKYYYRHSLDTTGNGYIHLWTVAKDKHTAANQMEKFVKKTYGTSIHIDYIKLTIEI